MSEPSSRASRRTQFIVAALVTAFAGAWFAAMGGLNVLAPTSIDWMLNGDWQGYLYCTNFVRNGPWSLPFGQAPDLMWPYGSTAAFNDCLPLTALIIKLFDQVLPLRAQPYGVWMLLSLVAMGLTGGRVLKQFTRDPVYHLLGSALFVASPLIAWRYGHPQFFTQFPLLALVALGLMRIETASEARTSAALALVLAAFTGSVTPYLAVMTNALALAVMIRLAMLRTGQRPSEKAAWLVALPLSSALVLWVFGFLVGSSGLSKLTAEGFGQFSADLGAFWNPMSMSRLLPATGATGRQGEGYAYLGAGVLALLILGATTLMRHLVRGWRPERRALLERLPLVTAVALCMVYAASSIVTLHGKQLLDLTTLYAPFSALTNVFRSSGRFAWPLHALFTLAAILAPLWLSPARWVQRSVLAAALALQIADVDLTKSGLRGPFAPFEPLTAPIWNEVPRDFRHYVIHPIMAQWACPYDEALVGKLSWEAYRHHLSINSGLAGRYPAALKESCLKHLAQSQLDDQSLYVVYFREYLVDFAPEKFTCGVVDRMVVCVTNERDTAVKRYLDAHPLPPGFR